MKFTRPILFASPVKDLTIARYLAAIEVDYIGIDLDQSDLKKLQAFINQLIEWIEGPKLIGVTAYPLQMQHLELGLHGFYADSDLSILNDQIRMHSLNYYNKYKPNKIDYILLNQNETSISQIPCLLQSSIKQYPKPNEFISGYLFSPGNEDKTGLFDFDELDAWIEQVKGLA